MIIWIGTHVNGKINDGVWLQVISNYQTIVPSDELNCPLNGKKIKPTLKQQFRHLNAEQSNWVIPFHKNLIGQKYPSR